MRKIVLFVLFILSAFLINSTELRVLVLSGNEHVFSGKERLKLDEGLKLEKEKMEDNKKAKGNIFAKKPLLGGGAALITIGAISIITGATLLVVTFGYFDPMVTDAVSKKLLFSEYETKYNTLITGLVSSSVSMGIGVIMLVAGFPMAVYTKKNVSINLEVGTTTTFSFSYNF
ncbi:MAG TPA: hypothetical protein PK771_09760 [Spirochaetota bacterium]|nr:hypothetical protein [Spirochaetota bacterium]